MKQNYNINRNYQPPSSEDIAKHMDFEALMQRVETREEAETKPKMRPMRALPWLAAFALAAACVGWFFFVNTGISTEEYKQMNALHFAQQDFINPPFKNIAAAQFASSKINASEGGVYEHVTGSRIVIPQAAFVDDKGAFIEGEVDIRYREFHDYVDFFLSGIPMTYDSAGVKYTLESAGMLEVYAEQNGKRVRMAPGKELNVELVSYVNMPQGINVPPGYNIYRLDEEKRNWIFTDVDKIQLLEEDLNNLDPNDPLTPAKQSLRAELKQISETARQQSNQIENKYPVPQKPIKPERTNGSDSVFELDFKDNPAMAGMYKNSLWQVSPRSTIKASDIMKNVEDAQLRKINNREFEITFTAGNRTQVVLVNPVLTGQNFDNALADFNKKMAEFERAQTIRNEKIAAEKAELEAQLAEQRRLAQMKYEDALAELQSAGKTAAASDLMIRRKIINRFRATEFGIWNCDRPLPPDIHLLKADFVTDKGNKIDNMTAYLVDKNENTVNRFLATDDARMVFNRNSKNLLWVVTQDNKIAIFESDDFEQIPTDSEKFTFTLKETGKSVENEGDVREVLSL